MLADLTTTLDELLALDPASLDDQALSDSVVAAVGVATAKLAALVGNLVGEWHRRELWRKSGARSAASWLSGECRIPKGNASQVMQRARMQRDHQAVAEALSEGTISGAHVDRLARATNPRTREAMAEFAGQLVDHAKQLPWLSFDRLVSYWSHHADPDGAEPRHNRRRVSLVQSHAGHWDLAGWLDPINGEIIAVELRRLEHKLYRSDVAEAKARLGRKPFASELGRTNEQRRADAFVEMARRSAEAPDGVKRSRPLVTLAVGSDVFPNLCEVLGGTILHVDELTPWLSEANVEKMFFADDGRTITHYNRRNFPELIARAARIKFRTCYHPHCGVPAHLCQIDHVEPYSQGGPTSFANARLACGPHNRDRNAELGLLPFPEADTGHQDANAAAAVLDRAPPAA